MTKSFKDKVRTNPAEQFISKDTIEKETTANQPPQEGDIVPTGYKLVPIEKKTQRVQLVLRPSLVQKGKDAAQAMGISFNELCHIAIERYLKEI